MDKLLEIRAKIWVEADTLILCTGLGSVNNNEHSDKQAENALS